MPENELIGSGWTFPPRFAVSAAGPNMVQGDALIQQSLFVLLSTRVGERIHDNAYGSALSDYVFQIPDAEMLSDMKEDIAKSIETHEHRVTLQAINFDTDAIYDGYLNIHLEYVINATNHPGNLVFPFYLTEG
ncbi:GPW/gp25 family protein [Alteromonas sp. a30]|uniref:GPW/gp25 family protein n=1 Tax=Alteromonas sp. a30 TaxID=2730917 RepID=UPI002281876E|nr:GPW/gp25 family protein [Alteromonas sp. a30]MCY7296521.1 GPW/gp25 family protein [Alteromonas sp. a30]